MIRINFWEAGFSNVHANQEKIYEAYLHVYGKVEELVIFTVVYVNRSQRAFALQRAFKDSRYNQAIRSLIKLALKGKTHPEASILGGGGGQSSPKENIWEGGQTYRFAPLPQ